MYKIKTNVLQVFLGSSNFPLWCESLQQGVHLTEREAENVHKFSTNEPLHSTSHISQHTKPRNIPWTIPAELRR